MKAISFLSVAGFGLIIGALKKQDKADPTIEVYARAFRWISEYFNCPPDVLNHV